MCISRLITSTHLTFQTASFPWGLILIRSVVAPATVAWLPITLPSRIITFTNPGNKTTDSVTSLTLQDSNSYQSHPGNAQLNIVDTFTMTSVSFVDSKLPLLLETCKVFHDKYFTTGNHTTVCPALLIVSQISAL